MRRDALTLVEIVVVVAIVMVLAAILLPVFQRPRHDERRFRCQSNLKMVALGFRQYLGDYDEKFPPVAVARSGFWAGSLQPYTRNWSFFQCPSTLKNQSKTTDYFYNARLSKVAEKSISDPSHTVLAGDGRDNSLTNYALFDLPPLWRSADKSPALRHGQNLGANYAFADGHVKFLTPEKIRSKARNSDDPRFGIN